MIHSCAQDFRKRLFWAPEIIDYASLLIYSKTELCKVEKLNFIGKNHWRNLKCVSVYLRLVHERMHLAPCCLRIDPHLRYNHSSTHQMCFHTQQNWLNLFGRCSHSLTALYMTFFYCFLLQGSYLSEQQWICIKVDVWFVFRRRRLTGRVLVICSLRFPIVCCGYWFVPSH